MDLAAKIVMLRERKGWSQIDLSRETGIPQPTICRLERGGIKQPKMTTLVRMARALEVSSDYLASDDYDVVQLAPPSIVLNPRVVVDQ